MKFDPNIHHRRSIRLKEFDYAQPGAYFITLVTHQHINLFGMISNNQMQLNDLGVIIRNVWLRIPRFFLIRHDEWVIMPNHMHGIIWILDASNPSKGELSSISDKNSSFAATDDALLLQRPNGTKRGSLGAIVQNFKSISTRKINQRMSCSGKGEAFEMINLGMSRSRISNASPRLIWQRNYFERVIRNEKELDRIRNYLIDNPRRWIEDEEYRK